MGHHPAVFTEIGIPYDMDDKHAYKTGDYTNQIRAMDANSYAIEGSRVQGYNIWNYTSEVRFPTFRLDDSFFLFFLFFWLTWINTELP